MGATWRLTERHLWARKGIAMRIKDVMTREPATCSPATDLAAAAALMLDKDCGILPVVDDHGKLVGVVTDRDMYIALATRNVLGQHALLQFFATKFRLKTTPRFRQVLCRP